MRKSKYTKEILENAVSNSSSIRQVLFFLNLKEAGGNYYYISKLLKQYNISTAHYLKQGWAKGLSKNDNPAILATSLKNRTPDEIAFSKNSPASVSGCRIKNKLLETGREYKCEGCGNPGVWCGSSMSLDVDHKNGVNNDNRLENLRFLCPNCHRQTPTWGNKRQPFNQIKGYKGENITINNLCGCGKEICKKSKECIKCHLKNIPRNKKFDIAADELQKLINEYPMTTVGKLLGVSDNAVRKRCKKLNLVI